MSKSNPSVRNLVTFDTLSRVEIPLVYQSPHGPITVGGIRLEYGLLVAAISEEFAKRSGPDGAWIGAANFTTPDDGKKTANWNTEMESKGHAARLFGTDGLIRGRWMFDDDGPRYDVTETIAATVTGSFKKDDTQPLGLQRHHRLCTRCGMPFQQAGNHKAKFCPECREPAREVSNKTIDQTKVQPQRRAQRRQCKVDENLRELQVRARPLIDEYVKAKGFSTPEFEQSDRAEVVGVLAEPGLEGLDRLLEHETDKYRRTLLLTLREWKKDATSIERH